MSFEDDSNPWGASAFATSASPIPKAASPEEREWPVASSSRSLSPSHSENGLPSPPALPPAIEQDDLFDQTLENLGAEDDLPPMDDFDEPTNDGSTQQAEQQPLDGEQDDDDDEFGFPQETNDADDDDFGDFDDTQFDDFESAAAPSAAAPAAPIQPAHVPRGPAFRFEPKGKSRQDIERDLRPVFDFWYPNAYNSVNDEPERQVEGPAQVLVSESTRKLLASLSSIPTLKPLDWRRSRTRRQHLVSLGVPVNLDDSSTSAPLASLVLPSVNPPRASSPAPHGRSTTPMSAHGPARTATPPAPAMLDLSRAEQLLAIQEQDLQLMSIEALRKLQSDLVKTSSDASHALTSALLAREQQVTDGEAYHVMIQDLVAAASKLKSTSSLAAGAGQTGGASIARPSSANSNKWNPTNRKASSSPAPRSPITR